MRISAKGRYALAAMINLAEHYNKDEHITIISISEKLGISKIYLEQVFSLLKRGGIVISVKGAQGGYQLSRLPQQITAWDILSAVELTLFESTEDTVNKNAPNIEIATRVCVYEALDKAVQQTLGNVTLYDLITEAEKHNTDQGLMFFI